MTAYVSSNPNIFVDYDDGKRPRLAADRGRFAFMHEITRLDVERNYSRVVVHQGTAYFSGLTADDWSGDIAAQTQNLLEKASTLLARLDANVSSLLSATIWLRDPDSFSGMNKVWQCWIDPRNPPARATVISSLAAPEILIEVQFIAAVG